MILLIDNYDSFVHTLARYVGELGCQHQVVRDDAISVAEIEASAPAAIILSPGPRTPDDAGISLELVRRLTGRIPILGVCLGHQTLVQAMGGTVRRTTPMHGRPAPVTHDGTGIFAGLPSPLVAGRYHSLAADRPADGPLRATAWSDAGEEMACAHVSAPLFGVQFHPESILTESGHALLANFLHIAGLPTVAAPPGDTGDRAA